MIPFVVLLVAFGILLGVLYSVPPFRLRKTAYKPIVNFTVGAVPVLIVVAFFEMYSISTVALVLLIGVTTAVNSLWEDLADYASDFQNGSKTLPIIFGYRNGLLLTVILGYTLIPLMVFVGFLFKLGWIYYSSLIGLAIFVSLRLIQKRAILLRNGKDNAKKIHKLGEILARDFVVIAIVFTLSLMMSSLLKINPIFL